jgi:hypothetical protein
LTIDYHSWEDAPDKIALELLMRAPGPDELGIRKWLAEQLGLEVDQLPPGAATRVYAYGQLTSVRSSLFCTFSRSSLKFSNLLVPTAGLEPARWLPTNGF